MRIAIDVAHGLSFLHSKEPSIIYHDLKASNILLDSEFNARLSDFGLARNGPIGDNIHVSTRVVGTSGYAAPEYVAIGKQDDGQLPMKEPWELKRHFLSDNRGVFRITDTRFGGRYSKKGAPAVATLVLKCLHIDPKYRPTMAEVVASLEE